MMTYRPKTNGFLAAVTCSFLLISMVLFTGCTVDQTKQAEAPDVDVDVDPGQWPAYDVEWADVDVGTATKTVTVPKLEVVREEETIEVPYIDIKAPGATDLEDRTIAVELEVPDGSYDVNITEIRAVGDTLWVVSELKKTDQPATQAINRVSDQVIVRAPEDLDIRKVVVGERPDGVYNQQYSFHSDASAIPAGGRVIYRG